MTYGELKSSVTESLGEDITTLDQLIAGTRAGFGDMIHRGYREFRHILIVRDDTPKTMYEKLMDLRQIEENVTPLFTTQPENLLTFDFPSDCLEILYIKLYFNNSSSIPTKLALGNPVILSRVVNGYYRTAFEDINYDTTPTSIFYKKGSLVYVEWDPRKIGEYPWMIEVGYYKTLPFISEVTIRRELGLSLKDPLDITDVEIPMPEDYCNVLVNFMIWYVASANGHEQEQLTVLKNDYKYSMEDLLARKNKEDQYDETTTVIKIDGNF